MTFTNEKIAHTPYFGPFLGGHFLNVPDLTNPRVQRTTPVRTVTYILFRAVRMVTEEHTEIFDFRKCKWSKTPKNDV